MLEIGIIICLAIALFLSLKNFPQTADIDIFKDSRQNVQSEEKKGNFMTNFVKRFFAKKKEETLDDLQRLIEKDNDKIVPPIEINQAKKTFKESDPELARILYESDLAFSNNDLRGAEDLAIEVISRDKKCAQAYVLIGKIAYHRGAFEDAKEALKTAIKCDSEIGESYFLMGLIEIRNENYTGAIDYFQKAVNTDRGVAEWYAELGKAYMQIRQFAKAAKALKRASSLDMDNKEYRDLASEAEDKQRTHSNAWGSRR